MSISRTLIEELINNCELCDLSRGHVITKKYYEDDKVIIVDCKSCEIPMLTLKDHRMDVSKKEKEEFTKLISRLFPESKIRKQQKKIPDHFHWHILGGDK